MDGARNGVAVPAINFVSWHDLPNLTTHRYVQFVLGGWYLTVGLCPSRRPFPDAYGAHSLVRAGKRATA